MNAQMERAQPLLLRQIRKYPSRPLFQNGRGAFDSFEFSLRYRRFQVFNANYANLVNNAKKTLKILCFSPFSPFLR